MRGRKPHSHAELLLMADVSAKFARVLSDRKDWMVAKAEKAAKELGVSRASFYNYLRKHDLPRYEILQRASRLWNLRFEQLDCTVEQRPLKPSPAPEVQLTLPFIEALRQQDVTVIKVIP